LTDMWFLHSREEDNTGVGAVQIVGEKI
jgi:hypothetical protein